MGGAGNQAGGNQPAEPRGEGWAAHGGEAGKPPAEPKGAAPSD